MKSYKVVCLLCVLQFFVCLNLHAQLCQGSFGNPLINISFGAGPNPGEPLAAATTNYQYTATDCPNDGFYTVIYASSNCFGSSWYNLPSDHTGNTNGYFMLVNASIQPSDFYVENVTGLCANTTYEFGAWISNVIVPSSCGSNSIQPNITFSIEKPDGTILQTANTNNIAPSPSVVWNRYGLIFTTPIGVSSIVLRMRNNATGGCGNDIALDDITFRPCGSQLTPTIVGIGGTNTSFCQGSAQAFNFTCGVSAGYNTPTYQWQQSFNGGSYVDIVGENTTDLAYNFTALAAIGVYNFVLNVAEAGNINSSACRISSTPISVTILSAPTVSIISDNTYCKQNQIVLAALGAQSYVWTGPNGFLSSTNPATIDNASPINAGTYFVTGQNTNGCQIIATTAIAINDNPIATPTFNEATICLGNCIQLITNGVGIYQWTPVTDFYNPNIYNPIVKPIDTTNYRIVVTSSLNCTDTAYCKVNVVKKPIVYAGPDKVIVANQSLQIAGSITGSYGSFYWQPPTYINNINVLNATINPPTETKYYLTVIAPNDCGTVSDTMVVKIFNGIFIPNTFTPNNDSKNDTWNLASLEAYPLYELTLYNRYGQMIFAKKSNSKAWDGKYKGEPQPNGAYTYFIDLKNNSPVIKGTVLILR